MGFHATNYEILCRLKLQVHHFVNISMAVKNYHTRIVTVRNPV